MDRVIAEANVTRTTFYRGRRGASADAARRAMVAGYLEDPERARAILLTRGLEAKVAEAT